MYHHPLKIHQKHLDLLYQYFHSKYMEKLQNVEFQLPHTDLDLYWHDASCYIELPVNSTRNHLHLDIIHMEDDSSEMQSDGLESYGMPELKFAFEVLIQGL